MHCLLLIMKTYVGLFLKFLFDKDNIVVGDGGGIRDGGDDINLRGKLGRNLPTVVIARTALRSNR